MVLLSCPSRGLFTVPVKGPFTWKEDDPSARIILESSFGLHAKTRLLGSTLNLVYMKFTCKILCSARLQSKMAGEKDKKLVLGVLPYLLALITAFQHQFAIIYNLIFQTQQQRAMIRHVVPGTRPQGHVRFQDGGQTGPPDAVYMEPGSS